MTLPRFGRGFSGWANSSRSAVLEDETRTSCVGTRSVIGKKAARRILGGHLLVGWNGRIYSNR